ncbi:MAG: hypothetical protein Q8O14_07590 [bacterium]|nr:hypothetical protein [bacterium]
MSKLLRQGLIVLAALSLAVVLALAALRWVLGRTPLDAPPRELRVVAQRSSLVDTPGGPRQFRDLVLLRGGDRRPPRLADTIHVSLSLPAEWDGRPLPAIVLMGGVAAGQRSLRYLDHHGANAILAYEYPYDQREATSRRWYHGHTLSQMPEIRRSVLAVPAQVRDLLTWTGSQPWADPERTVLLGFSFGALFAPAVQQVLQRHDLTPAATVLAYGGVDLGLLLRHNLRKVPPWSRPMLAWTVESLIRPVEPARHLPGLSGEFLAINGRHDEQIPLACATRLHAGLPPGAEIVLLDAGHLHPRRLELMRQVATLAADWLVERGVAEP